MVISGLHVSVLTSVTVKISPHGFGRSSVFACTHTETFLKNVYRPNFSENLQID